MATDLILPAAANPPADPLTRRLVGSVGRALEAVERGSLRLHLPDGRAFQFGRTGEDPSATLSVRDWRFFRRLAVSGDVGAGESYVDGDWDADDLVSVVRVFAANAERLASASSGSPLLALVDRVRHLARANSRPGARRNIAAHYDLSNDFYRLWLDPGMVYSCALFSHPECSLEDAQRTKLERVAALVGLGPGMRVLEIGCGWGAFLELVARDHGCDAVGLTLSAEQARFARQRLARAGVSDRARVELLDYRDVSGTFDAVVSIEMLEAVGHAHLARYFAAVERLLAPGGRAAIQTITIPDHRYDSYRRRPDFIQKHVFPGGHLPSVGAIAAAVAPTHLVVERLESFGPHYAETLRRWRRAFLDRRREVAALGFDRRFQRLWDYYLAYCEGAFAEGMVDVVQLVLARPGQRPLRAPVEVER